MEKRVNYAISGQNLDIVTKTSDKNLLILKQVCITAELFWKLERIVPEIYTYMYKYIFICTYIFVHKCTLMQFYDSRPPVL